MLVVLGNMNSLRIGPGRYTQLLILVSGLLNPKKEESAATRQDYAATVRIAVFMPRQCRDEILNKWLLALESGDP